MKFRRLNTLLLAAALLTTGGVYASWSYAQGQVGQATVEKPVEMDTVVVTSPKGTINVEEDGLTLLVKNDGNYNTVLDISGSLKVSFTPDPGADAIVKDKGIKLQISINVSEFTPFNSTTVFTVEEPHLLNKEKPVKDEIIVLGKAQDADDESTANCDESVGLSRHITMTEFNLDTYEEFEDFDEYLTGKKIYIVVSEYVEP